MADPVSAANNGDTFDLDDMAVPQHTAGDTIDLAVLDAMSFERPAVGGRPVKQRSQKAVAALIRRGDKARKARQWVEAAKYLNEAWAHDPENVSVVKVLAEVVAKMGARSKAIDLYLYAFERAPHDSEIPCVAGQVALDMELWAEAEKLNSVFIELEPLNPVGYVNRATALRKLERFDEAVDMLQHALPLLPESADLWNVLGSVVNMRDDLDTALPFYQEALRLDPSDFKTPNNIARALNDLGRYEDAIPYAQSSFNNTPDRDPVVHFTLAMAQLGAGKLPDAWESYACRLDNRRQDAIRYALDVPYIGDKPLEGKKIVVVPEQGVGDEILFLSALADLIEIADEVAVGCDARLVDLVKRSFPSLSHVVAYADTAHEGYRIRVLQDLPDRGKGFDGYVPMGDLFCRFRKDVAAFQNSTQGYLVPNDTKVAELSEWLPSLGEGLKIGICWRSGFQKAERNFWYADQSYWEPILKTPGVTFVNLQYGDCEEELAEFKNRFGTEIHQYPGLNLRNDLDDAAALTAALDGVVSIGAQPAMTAFGVDQQVFWLFPFPPWWNFGERTYAPMHKKSRFFMGEEPMDWAGAAAKAAKALTQLVDQYPN
ncbi:MAG: tetratricopeptide repeat protein [Pseudomonadota bacterium]